MTNINKHIESLNKKISELASLEEKINAIASYAKIITGARRCSLFIYAEDKAQLKSIYNDELDEHIIIKSNIGLVGYAFHNKQTVLENDVNTNPVFFNAVDKQFNFTTRNILAVPILAKDKHCLGVIELLNKKMNFDQHDQDHIEALTPLISSLLISKETTPVEDAPKGLSTIEMIQSQLSTYLDNSHLHLMENGYAYYKILDMKRIYYIGADTCYQLSQEPKEIELHYYTNDKEFSSTQMLAMIDDTTGHILISENRSKKDFIYYPFEQDT